MLFNLEPDRSLTGGAWYCDQDFEAEFVDVLNQQCYRYLQQRKEKTVPIAAKSGPLVAQTMAYSTSKDVWKFITELGISKVSGGHITKIFLLSWLLILIASTLQAAEGDEIHHYGIH